MGDDVVGFFVGALVGLLVGDFVVGAFVPFGEQGPHFQKK